MSPRKCESSGIRWLKASTICMLIGGMPTLLSRCCIDVLVKLYPKDIKSLFAIFVLQLAMDHWYVAGMIFGALYQPLQCLHIASMIRGSLITSFLLLHMFPCVGTLISIEIRWTTKSMVIHANLNNENLKCLGILTKLDRSYSNFQVTSSTNILDQDL